jgi:hypothetical protein
MANFAVVHTETNDESKPAGSRARSLGDDDIREFKRTIRERLAVDHIFLADESGENAIGIHKQVTMRALVDDPTAYDDVGYLYLKTVSGVIEFFYKDSAGKEIQMSTNGKILGDNVQLTNNTYLKAKNAAGVGTVDLIKANASDKPVLPDGSQLATSAAPTQDADIANKKFVDDSKVTDHGALGGLTDNDHPLYARGQGNNYKIDSGSLSVPSGYSSTAVSFNFTFASVPVVVVSDTRHDDEHGGNGVGEITTTGFNFKNNRPGSAFTGYWIAVGPVAA